MTPGKKAARTRKEKEIARGYGTVSVYVMHSNGFHGRLRPAYDTAAHASGSLSDAQASRLRTMISRFIRRCEEQNRSAMTDE